MILYINDWQVVETINAMVTRAHLFGVRVVYLQHENDSFLKKGLMAGSSILILNQRQLI